MTALLLFHGGDDIRKLKKYTPTKFMSTDSKYDKDAADFAVMFIEQLCHTKGIPLRVKQENLSIEFR